nr:MAG TPA: hypothetical protein [Caudoviricetes sp.]
MGLLEAPRGIPTQTERCHGHACVNHPSPTQKRRYGPSGGS